MSPCELVEKGGMGEKKRNEGGGGGERKKCLPANPMILKNCEFNPLVSLSYFIIVFCSCVEHVLKRTKLTLQIW